MWSYLYSFNTATFEIGIVEHQTKVNYNIRNKSKILKWLTYAFAAALSRRVASNILLDMMLQQRHERAMQELEIEMKVELQRSRDQINNELNAEMMAALSVST